MAVIKVYVDDETHEKLKAYASTKGKTITQVAGQVLREKFISKEVLNEIIGLLKMHAEAQQRLEKKINEVIAYADTLAVNLAGLIRAANIQMPREEEHLLTDKIRSLVKAHYKEMFGEE